MDYEKTKKKLQKLNKHLDGYKQEELLRRINKIYEEAKGNEKFASDFKKTVQKIKKSGELTAVQIAELEEKANKLSKAVELAKELRQNTDKDKIDDYVEGKIEENEEEKAHYKEQNKILKDQKEKVEGVFEEYQHNQEAEKVTEKISKVVGKIENELGNNPSDQKSLKKYGKELIDLLGNKAIEEKKLDRWIAYFGNGDPNKWEKSRVTDFNSEVTTAKADYASKKTAAETEFRNRLTMVPDQYKNTAIETKLKDIDTKHKKVEDKWTALGGQIERNESEIKRITAQIKNYKDYAKDIKGIDEAAEEANKLEEISDEEMDTYLRDEKGIDINEAIGLNRLLSENEAQHQDLLAMKNREIDLNEAIQWKRMRYYEKRPVKLAKALVKVNKKIKRANRKRSEEDKIEEATTEDIIYNTEKIKDISFRGKNRYRFRSRKFMFANRAFYRRQYRKFLDQVYIKNEENLKSHIENDKSEEKEDFRARYRQDVQSNLEAKKERQNELINNIIQRDTESQR